MVSLAYRLWAVDYQEEMAEEKERYRANGMLDAARDAGSRAR